MCFKWNLRLWLELGIPEILKFGICGYFQNVGVNFKEFSVIFYSSNSGGPSRVQWLEIGLHSQFLRLVLIFH